MNHPDEALIHDFVDDELPKDERARIAAHLAECTVCRNVAGQARSLREEAVRVFGDASPVTRQSTRLSSGKRSRRGSEARRARSSLGSRQREAPARPRRCSHRSGLPRPRCSWSARP